MNKARRIEIPLGAKAFHPGASWREKIRWEEPHNRFYTSIEQATLTLHLPGGSGPWPWVLVLPGGGYSGVSLDKEGHHVADYLASQKFAGLVLKYRLPTLPPKPLPEPVQDVLLACEEIAKWPELAEKRGIFLGFSAGGHLAGICGLRWEHWNGLRATFLPSPAALALIYPVVTFQGELGRCPTRANLLGENPPLREFLSLENAVQPSSPPLFLAHSEDDEAAPIGHSELLAAACQRAGVSVEFHRFPGGGHGYGLAEGQGPHSQWAGHFVEFARKTLRDIPGD